MAVAGYRFLINNDWMLHSMTGFARQSAETEAGTLTWELRTVNHRYLDIHFRLPEELRPKEQHFKQHISSSLGRGKVDCTLHLARSPANENDLQINMELVALLRKRVTEIATALHDTQLLNPLDVLRWPGVISEPDVDAEPLFEDAAALLDTTLQAMSDMRRAEGGRIATMLAARCADIALLSESVRERLPEVLAAAHKKQRERIERLDIESDPARLEIELALIAQKLDVDEELDRLDSHLKEIAGAINSDGPVGRRLDFLMQELNREANTLGSKSADAQTTKAAVELKVLIEQMREQIQNVE
jgi:uncharacterized protein (TIGR00255 family)